MNTVKVTPNKEGQLVTAYAGNPEFGYMLLAQTSSNFVNGWLKETTKRTIMKGSTAALQAFVASNPSLEVPGQLVTKEFLEGEVPAHIAKAHFDESLPYAEQIGNYIKRAGEDGPELTIEGKRILRFTLLDANKTDVDVIIQHDNVAEVAQYNAVQKNKEIIDADLDK